MVNQEEADRDIPKLLAVPAAKRFLSIEPMLGPITVFSIDGPVDVYDGMPSPIHWIIVGSESGRGARPMEIEWARSIKEQCQQVGTPFFMKQIIESEKKVPMADWPLDMRVQEFPV